MSRAFDFVEGNIRTIGFAYLIVAAFVFLAVLLFFWWIARAEDKERELYPEDACYQEEEMNTVETIFLALLMAIGCAILWIGIPIILVGTWAYQKITEKFPELTGHMADFDNEMEEKE